MQVLELSRVAAAKLREVCGRTAELGRLIAAADAAFCDDAPAPAPAPAESAAAHAQELALIAALEQALARPRPLPGRGARVRPTACARCTRTRRPGASGSAVAPVAAPPETVRRTKAI